MNAFSKFLLCTESSLADLERRDVLTGDSSSFLMTATYSSAEGLHGGHTEVDECTRGLCWGTAVRWAGPDCLAIPNRRNFLVTHLSCWES